MEFVKEQKTESWSIAMVYAMQTYYMILFCFSVYAAQIKNWRIRSSHVYNVYNRIILNKVIKENVLVLHLSGELMVAF